MGYMSEPEDEMSEDEVDAKMEEAEARWREVGYYKTLMTAQLFEDTGPIVERVTKRLQGFARREISSIVDGRGEEVLSKDPAQGRRLRILSSLSDEQVQVLVRLVQVLDVHKVDALSAVLERIINDPSAVRNVIAPTLRKLPAVVAVPTAPAAVRPPGRRLAPTAALVRTPAKPVADKKSAKSEKTPSGRFHSPSAAPFPTGDSMTASTKTQAAEAVRASDQLVKTELAAADARERMLKDDE